jgi:hypothetical protein
MNRPLRDLLLIAFLVLVWGGSGYIIGAALTTLGLSEALGLPRLEVIGAALNVIAGMFALAVVNGSPELRRFFYEGPDEKGGNAAIGCLWGLPLALLIGGLMMWLMAALLRSLGPK